MATRRSLGLGGEREDDGGSDFYDDAGGMQGLLGGGEQGGRVDEFGNNVPDFSGPNFPKPFTDYTPEEIAGNTERGVDLKGPSGIPTRSQTPQAPMSMMSSPAQENSMGLPQGVSVNEGMFSGAPDSGYAMDAPAQSAEPNPIAGQLPNPTFAQPEGGSTRGPVRRSNSNPAIFAEHRSPMLMGRADGLLGGGKGISGGESSGALAPSEMFQKLLQLFKQQ
jgi:hypothetical protein